MIFEAFHEGQTYTLKPITVTREDIIAYAEKFDPQRLHVDEDYAASGPFGGLIASGYHTLSLVWSRWIDADILGDESMGGPGLDRVQWLAPVRPADTLSTTVTITARRRSQSQPRGIISLHFDVVNQDRVRVMAYEAVALVKLGGGA